MKFLKSFKTIISLLLVTFVTMTNAQAFDQVKANSIVEKASLAAYYAGNDGRTLARMKIVDANGRKQLRQFTILRKNLSQGGEQQYLVVFSRPSDVSGTVFMVHKKPGKLDDRWLYLPALDLVKRVSAGDKRTSFVGAHYFYEDVSGRSPTEDNHMIESEDEKNYVLKHIPKEPSSVEFASYKTWIDKKTYLPMTIEYYDAADKPIRKIEAVEVEIIQGIPSVTRAKVTNLADGSYTLMAFKKMSYDLGIPSDIFNEGSLRNPPAEWLRID